MPHYLPEEIKENVRVISTITGPASNLRYSNSQEIISEEDIRKAEIQAKEVLLYVHKKVKSFNG